LKEEKVKTEEGAPLAVEKFEGAEAWTLTYPPVNAIGPQWLDDVTDQLEKSIADPETSVVVVTSGLRLFSAGADTAWMAQEYLAHGGDGLVDNFSATMDRFRELCKRMRHAPLLFIAAIGGHALAGGLEFAAACDLRFASDEDRIQIGVPEMKHFGVMPSGGGGAQFLARILGPSRALFFILDGNSVTPREAYRLGLVDRLIPPEDLLPDTLSFASRVARQAGRVGIAACKHAVMEVSELPFDQSLERDRAVHWDSVRKGKFLSGIPAFIDQFGATAKRT
jgi:enoyl-CoA hydratase